MLEIPESSTIAKQLEQTIKGKTVQNVFANSSPHGFAFYFGDPDRYQGLLSGKTVDDIKAIAGNIEISAEDTKILFGDGVNIRYYENTENLPKKHQLHIEFEDFSSIVCTVQMYGGLWAFVDGENDSPYYKVAKEKPSPLSKEFDEYYFKQLVDGAKKNMSLKAFLATEQRIPGLGNGTLQDILFRANMHPASKLYTLSGENIHELFKSVTETLTEMTEKGGRDTERDLFGCSGGYKTILSNKTLKKPCAVCDGLIVRKSYMGGNIYYCPQCQPVAK